MDAFGPASDSFCVHFHMLSHPEKETGCLHESHHQQKFIMRPIVFHPRSFLATRQRAQVWRICSGIWRLFWLGVQVACSMCRCILKSGMQEAWNNSSHFVSKVSCSLLCCTPLTLLEIGLKCDFLGDLKEANFETLPCYSATIHNLFWKLKHAYKVI